MVKKTTQRDDNAIQTPAEPVEPAGGLYDRHGYITTSVRLTSDVMKALKTAAYHADVNKSEIIRRSIVEYLTRHPELTNKP